MRSDRNQYYGKKKKKRRRKTGWVILFLVLLLLGRTGRDAESDDDAKTKQGYTTQVESELTYEMILAWEAADENYVDEKTGKVVLTGADSGTDYGEETEGEKQIAEETKNDSGGDEDGALPGIAKGKVADYPAEKLGDYDYLIQNFYQVDSSTTITSSELDAAELLQKDMTLTHGANTPQILIYHTHGHEGYVDSVEGDYSTGIIGVGDYLTELLTEEYGLNVIHHTGIYDTDRDTAYSRAGPAL
jgi:stage II sporulation protein P